MRISAELNKHLWNKGIRNVPRRVRVRLYRKRNENEGAKHKLYTLVEWVPTVNFKGMSALVTRDCGGGKKSFVRVWWFERLLLYCALWVEAPRILSQRRKSAVVR